MAVIATDIRGDNPRTIHSLVSLALHGQPWRTEGSSLHTDKTTPTAPNAV